jgi:DNA-binding beta-propeller fold protein YncE
MLRNNAQLLALAAALCVLTGAAQAGDMKIAARWALPGPVAWDYLALDSSGAHLFVTRGTQVDVIDTRKGQVTASIANTAGAHGVALAEALRRGYISSGKSDTVLMFDLDTFKTLQEAPVSGHNPDAILFDAIGQHVYTFNGRSSDVSVLSAKDLKVETTFKVPGKPEFAVANDEGEIFVNIETEPGQLAVIDARKLAVKSVWPLPNCDSPSGLAIDKAHKRLFSVCDNKVMVVTDAVSGAQVAKISIGEGPDAAAYDAQRSLVFSSNGDGSLSVIHQQSPDSYMAERSVATKRGARTMALDLKSGAIFLSSADYSAAPAGEHTRPQAVPESFAILKVMPK